MSKQIVASECLIRVHKTTCSFIDGRYKWFVLAGPEVRQWGMNNYSGTPHYSNEIKDGSAFFKFRAVGKARRGLRKAIAEAQPKESLVYEERIGLTND